MGRFVSGGGAVPRKQSVRVTASNPSVAIPSWARVAYITGCAPGGGAGNSTTGGQRGGGGGAGGYANRVPVQITNETSIAVVIGSLGAGAAGGANASGAAGGDTTVTVGSLVLRLEGGRPGDNGATGGAGGRAFFGDLTGISNSQNNVPFGGAASQGLTGAASPISSGAGGGAGNTSAVGFGAGATSAFGAGGPGVASVTANAVGGNATGFGGGGAGGNGTGKGGNGAPGFILIEFEEAA